MAAKQIDIVHDIPWRKCDPVHHRIPCVPRQFLRCIGNIFDICSNYLRTLNRDIPFSSVEQEQLYPALDRTTRGGGTDITGSADK
jgi:hypothetical protein